MSTPRPQASARLQIDNDRVRVTEWRFAPGANTGWHKHGHDYVVVPLMDGKVRLETPTGPAHAEMKAGVPYFRHAGVEFIYMLSGAVAYRHGDKVYDLGPGDALLEEVLDEGRSRAVERGAQRDVGARRGLGGSGRCGGLLGLLAAARGCREGDSDGGTDEGKTLGLVHDVLALLVGCEALRTVGSQRRRQLPGR